jgi:hypothetical protein
LVIETALVYLATAGLNVGAGQACDRLDPAL